MSETSGSKGKVIIFPSKERNTIEDILGDHGLNWPAAARKELAEAIVDICDRHQMPPLTLHIRCGYTQEQYDDLQQAGTDLLLEINRRFELLKMEHLIRLACDIAYRHGIEIA